MSVVLASGSATRLKMLRDAGVPAIADPAHVDEAAIKDSLAQEGADASRVAEALAELKAVRTARRRPGMLVIGADQVLECEGRLYDKPADMDGARAQLQALRGKRHQLVTAAVAVRDGTRIWHHIERARLLMRPFSDEFLDWYLAEAGPAVLSSVGAYQLEGLGAQLFAKVEGDHFTILGLPMLQLLDFLRVQGAVRT